MGFFKGMKAIKAVNQIKKGKKAKMSYAMIAMLVINLSDARLKLTPQQYKQVETLFYEFQRCNTMFEVGLDGYIKLCEDVIWKFNKIAPYELYSGGNELEFSIMMEDLKREEAERNNAVNDVMELTIESFEIDENYIQQLMASNPVLTRDQAIEFYKILVVYSLKGKSEALNRFDSFVTNMAEEDPIQASIITAFLCGALEPNGVVTHEESTRMSKEYSDKILSKLM